MCKDRYIIFDDPAKAKEFVDALDRRINEHWDDPIQHPFENRTVVSWNDEYLSKATDMLDGRKTFSCFELIQEGWALGYHRGVFAKASAKLEDAMSGRDALELFNDYPNFPAFRSVFYGILSALYGVKEGLRKAATHLGPEAEAWWDGEFKKIKANPTLSLFYDLHNSDKHSLDDSVLHPKTKFFGYIGPAPHVISGEGVFWIFGQGTKDERRAFLPGAKAVFECYLVTSHGISEEPAKTPLDQVIEHYKELVWTAKKRFGEGGS